MRARQPDIAETIDRDGVGLAYEVFGIDQPNTILLLPTWSIVHSRHWKAQVPVLARHHRVVTFDGRGNGASDRPPGADAYLPEEFVADAVAVLDATDTDRAMIAGVSFGGLVALHLAAQHPDRVAAACFVGALIPFVDAGVPAMFLADFDSERDSYEGWELYNRHAYHQEYRRFIEFFFHRCFPEAHSTKQHEDAVGWALETDPTTLTATSDAHRMCIPPLLGSAVDDLCAAVSCPALHIHGDRDEITPLPWAAEAAARTGGDLLTVEGGGHLLQAREPVVVNDALLDLAGRAFPRPPRRTTWTRALRRPRRALYVSSPIGLGHAQRDIAIADDLRRSRPDLQIEWLAQHPVTTMLETREETIHPASAWLSSESAHIESESHEHDLHAFQAIRNMDEVLLSNFTVFDELLRDEHFDLVVADEAWDLDHFLHENPERKNCSFVWMTDFVGWLPVSGDEDETRVVADYNAEMIEHIDRFSRIRDRSIFVGDPDDIVPDCFGPDLPAIRTWTEEHFSFSGYVTGFDVLTDAERRTLRHELGYRDDEVVCIVTVGGSGVGTSLLHRVIAAQPIAGELIPSLRTVIVTGPRIDPNQFPQPADVELRSYVPGLYRHLAVCDLAVVQGGLTTTMELTAARRPFLYFPLQNHFEQQRHVRHRLDRHRAGTAMDYRSSTPDDIAEAMARSLNSPTTDYLPVESAGSRRAADLIAELL